MHLQQTIGDPLAQRDAGMLVARLQEEDHNVIQEVRRALVTDDGVMVELRKLLVGGPGFAVFVELRLPTMRYFSHDTAAVNDHSAAGNVSRDLLGQVAAGRGLRRELRLQLA